MTTALKETKARTETKGGSVVIAPCRDASQLREYIDTYWRKGHVLARNEKMFDFQYRTPWVDRSAFPEGVSVVCAYDGTRLLGFLGAIVAPYPRPVSYWLALWHVLPELKGGGQGGKLLQTMQEFAVGKDGRGNGWIGTFGAGPEALPVYLKRGYACRAVRRWVYAKTDVAAALPRTMPLHSDESTAAAEWVQYRYAKHPVFKYETRGPSVFRTEENAWGVVTHCVRLAGDWRGDVAAVHERDAALAKARGKPHLMDAWAFDIPGPGWTIAPEDLPSVFHPPEARGSVTYAVGRPFVPTMVQKGECDQDRPN